jgi:hypothetical protein
LFPLPEQKWWFLGLGASKWAEVVGGNILGDFLLNQLGIIFCDAVFLRS